MLLVLALAVLAAAATDDVISAGLEDSATGAMFLKDGVFEMSGGAFVKSATEYLRADRIRYRQRSGEVEAEGAVLLSAPPYMLHAASAVYNIRQKSGVLKAVTAHREFERPAGARGRIERGEVDVVVLDAESVRKHGDEYSARNVSLTTCGMDPPHYVVSAESAVFSAASGLASLHGCRLKWGDATLLRFSLIESRLEDVPRSVFPRFRAGRRYDWGFWCSAGFRRPLDDGFEETALSYRIERGPGIGYERRGERHRLRLGLVYEAAITTADDAQRAADNLARRGDLLNGAPTYVPLDDFLYQQRRLLDTIGAPDNSPILYADEPRWRLEAAWHTLDAPWRISAALDVASDRDYLYEYDRRDYYTLWDRATYVEAEQSSQWALSGLEARLRLEDFRTDVEYLPELRIRTLPFILGAGLDLATDLRAGFLRRGFDAATARQGFESVRTHAAAVLSRRFDIADGLALTPFVEARQTWYSNSRTGGELVQAGISGGADLGACITGSFAGGLTHTIQPVVSYRNTTAVTADPLDVYDFDDLEDFAAGERVGLALYQDWWRRSGRQLLLLGRLSLRTAALLDAQSRSSLNAGNLWAPLSVDAAVHAGDGAGWRPSLLVDARIGLHGEGLLDIYSRLGIERPPSAGVRNRLDSAFAGYSALAADPANGVLPDRRLEGGFAYTAGRYTVEWAMGYEFEDNSLVQSGQVYNRLRLTRDFHDLRLGIGLYYAWEEGQVGVTVRLEPSGYPPLPFVGSLE